MRRATIITFLIFLVLIPLGGFGGFMLDFAIADLIYPDPCIYHVRSAPKHILFTAFFNYDGSTGYHPEPSLFSMFFYAFIGVVASGFIARFLSRRIKSKLTA